MSTAQPRVDTSVPDIEPLGPGPRLRQAREKADISLEEIAARLHLDSATIEALETNAYGMLPAPTFVRGYLRGYARLVGLTQEKIVDEFDSQGLAPPALVADISESPQARTTDLPVRLATWAIIAVVVLLAIMWWRSQNQASLPEVAPGALAPETVPEPDSTPPDSLIAGDTGSIPSLPDGAEGATADDAPAAEAAAPAGPAEQPGELPADAAGPADLTIAGRTLDDPAPDLTAPDAPMIDPTPGAATPSVADATRDTSPEAVAQAADAGTSVAVAAAQRSPDADVLAQPLTPDAAGVLAGGPAGSAPDGDERLSLRFAGESWVEIYDRDEQRLFFNLVQPGRTVDVAGPPPLRVLLGRAEGVEVVRNGEPFDISPFVSRGLARFTVGGTAGAGQPGN